MRTRAAGVPRQMWFAAAALLVLLAFAVALGWLGLDPGPLRSITVVSTDGAAGPGDANFWRVSIDDRNRYVYSKGAVERRGSMAFAPYAQRFRAIPEIRWSLPPRGTIPRGTIFWAAGSRRTVVPFVPAGDMHHKELRDFANALRMAVVADVLHADGPRIAALNSLDGLTSLVLNARGGMCSGCYWDLAIDADGDARAMTFQNGNGLSAQTHHARVRWSSVTAVLREARWGEFDPRYGANASDVSGAAFTFNVAAQHYTVSVPDFTEAPPPLLRSYACLMLIAEAARWSPPFAPLSMPSAEGLRLTADQPDGYAAAFSLRATGHATPPPHRGPCKR